MRKMDAFRTDVESLRQMNFELSKFEKEARKRREERDKLQNKIIAAMQSSTEATIDGEKAFEIVSTNRRSTSIDLVMQFAPELEDKLVVVKESKKVKFA